MEHEPSCHYDSLLLNGGVNTLGSGKLRASTIGFEDIEMAVGQGLKQG